MKESEFVKNDDLVVARSGIGSRKGRGPTKVGRTAKGNN